MSFYTLFTHAKWVLVFFCLQSVVVHAQKEVTGTIQDAQTKEPLVGASVSYTVKQRTLGTTTDANGQFALRVPDEVTNLRISLVGYQTLTQPIANQPLLIQLEAGALLEEVVVTALGLERDSKKLGYAIQQVSGQAVSQIKSAIS